MNQKSLNIGPSPATTTNLLRDCHLPATWRGSPPADLQGEPGCVQPRAGCWQCPCNATHDSVRTQSDPHIRPVPAVTTMSRGSANLARGRIQAGSKVDLSLNPVLSLTSLEQIVCWLKQKLQVKFYLGNLLRPMAWETAWVIEELLQRADAGARKYMNLFFWKKNM